MLILQSFFIALLLTRVTATAGHRMGLLDQPDVRKSHACPVPLTGGIAIFMTMLAGTAGLAIAPLTYPMLAIACLVFMVGVFDDFRHIKPSLRLLIQLGSGVLLATWGGIFITNVGNLLAMGDIPLLLLSVPLTAPASPNEGKTGRGVTGGFDPLRSAG